ncbi:hypothetical protein MMYC01_201441 [Madurella mycetomatis]|uniref:Small acidic protein n=1 Tax=Madurella mycetomatis TaxID=100816 RepID=A0A175WC60_9PEZI|nr:hypothetical protein MMYC01_201441 [Madurella mycetomatis]
MGDKSKKIKDREEAAKVESLAVLEAQAPGVSEVHDAQTKAANQKSKEKKDRKRKRELTDPPVESETSAGHESGKLNEEIDIELVKKRSKKDCKSKGDKVKKTKDREDKKDAKQEESGNDQDAAMNAGEKKGKKRKKEAKHQKETQNSLPTRNDESMGATAGVDKEKEKKKKRKHKHRDQTGDVEMVDVNTASSEFEETKAEKEGEDSGRKRKKAKDKSKKRKDSAVSEEAPKKEAPKKGTLKKEGPTLASPPTAEVDLSERWNVHGLGGGAKRQDKFMRLLGGKKHGITAPAEAKESARQRFDIGRVEQQLEQQYDAGIRMKFEGGGQRRGLGA